MPSKSHKYGQISGTHDDKCERARIPSYQGFWSFEFQGYNGTAGSKRLCIDAVALMLCVRVEFLVCDFV